VLADRDADERFANSWALNVPALLFSVDEPFVEPSEWKNLTQHLNKTYIHKQGSNNNNKKCK